MPIVPDGLRLIDPHIHQWDPYTTPRQIALPAKIVRRIPGLLGPVTRLVPKADREFVGDPQYVLHPYLPTNYLADATPLDVEAVVHIEAAWHGKGPLGSVGETRWVAGLPFGANGTPRLGGIVVRADPRTANVAEVLDAHLASSDLVRGVRCSASHHPDSGVRSWTKPEHLLTEPNFLRGFAAIAERGLTFEVWIYSHQLPDLVTLASEYPQTTFVLNHYATPVGIFGPRGTNTGHTVTARRDILARWSDDVAAAAALPNTVAKQSGMGMPLLGLPSPPAGSPLDRSLLRDAMAPLVLGTDEVFGADRTIWASNFPIDKPNVTLPATVDILLEILGSRADPLKLLRENAARVYRLAQS